MSVTIDDKPQYITTSALKELMTLAHEEVKVVSTTVSSLKSFVAANSATWNEVSALSGKQDKLDFEYKEIENIEE